MLTTHDPHFSMCKLDTYRIVFCDKTCSGNDVSACWFPAQNWENQVTPGVLRRLVNIVRKRQSPASQSSLTVLSVEWFHTRCYWMSTKRFKILVLMSTNTVCNYHTPLFFHTFFLRESKTNSVTHLALGFYIYNWKKKKSILWIWCLQNQVP